jgi:hypothetical protein
MLDVGPGDDGPEEPDGEEGGGLAELLKVHDPVLAEIMRGRLVAEGIDALLFDAGFAGLLGGAYPGVRLMVRRRDLSLARRLLDLPNE